MMILLFLSLLAMMASGRWVVGIEIDQTIYNKTELKQELKTILNLEGQYLHIPLASGNGNTSMTTEYFFDIGYNRDIIEELIKTEQKNLVKCCNYFQHQFYTKEEFRDLTTDNDDISEENYYVIAVVVFVLVVAYIFLVIIRNRRQVYIVKLNEKSPFIILFYLGKNINK